MLAVLKKDCVKKGLTRLPSFVMSFSYGQVLCDRGDTNSYAAPADFHVRGRTRRLGEGEIHTEGYSR